jgi:hypothetical protein
LTDPEQPAGDELEPIAEADGDAAAANGEAADAEPSAPSLGLEEGEQVADVIVQELLGTGGGVAAWCAARADGSQAVVFNLVGEPTDDERDRFLAGAGDITKRMAEEPMEGILEVSSVDPIAGAYVGNVGARATFEHIPASGWARAQKVDLLIALCRATAQLHNRGIVHGCIRPQVVLLDGDKQPVLANARSIRINENCRGNPQAIELHRAYAAPELRMGKSASEPADVYAMGRVLHFMLTGEEPEEVDEKLPRLDSLKDEPDPLVGVIRRCTAMDPDHRYANADELAAELERYQNGAFELGYAHPDKGGTLPSVRPPAHAAAVRMRKTAEPARTTKPPPAKPSKSGWTRLKGTIAAVIALALIIAPTLFAYYNGVEHIALMIVVGVAGIPLAGAPPNIGSRPFLIRGVLAAGFCGVLLFLDPAGMAGSAQHHLSGLKSPDVNERLKAFQERVKAGDKVITGVDLSGANLAGMQLNKLELDGIKLNNSNCKGTNFNGSSLINGHVAGADFSGAVLVGVIPEFLVGWEQAKCDDNTTMPNKWRCADGVPGLAE